VIEGATFAATVLRGARLERCRLVRCRFTHADLRETTFTDCRFSEPGSRDGARFAFSRLEEARFARCDLSQARFEGCELYDLRLETCQVLAAAFPRCTFARTFGRKVEKVAGEMIDCNLELADLSGLRLPGGSLARSRLREADLSGADLEGADLTGADLFQAIIDETKLAGADLRGAEVSGLDLRRLASYRDLKIAADQQFRLLDAMGIDVQPE
jgi:fluoroquinolone resistance protein